MYYNKYIIANTQTHTFAFKKQIYKSLINGFKKLLLKKKKWKKESKAAKKKAQEMLQEQQEGGRM